MRNLAYMYFGESPDSLTAVRGWPDGSDHDDTINLTLRRPETASRWAALVRPRIAGVRKPVRLAPADLVAACEQLPEGRADHAAGLVGCPEVR
jgi:hypothetical protein